MSRLQNETRLNYIDHFRGLVITFVVLQHAVQGYARQWGGRLWFIDLPDRDRWFDAIFMWTDGFIMQALFFAAGLFVLPSLYRRGWLSFIKEKMIRLGIPLVFGILVLVPPLKYLKYAQRQDPGIGYFEYWFDVFLQPHSIGIAGFWFLAMLLLFTFIAATTDKLLPFIKNWLGCFARWLCQNPILGYLIVGVTTALIIGISDIVWGTYWWIGVGNLFNFEPGSVWNYILRPLVARANMLYTYVFFFILGIGFAQSGILKESDFLEKASKNWLVWLTLLVFLSFAYSWYNNTYLLDGAFSDEIHLHFYYGGTWESAWSLVFEVAPGILIRTTLHGFLCTTQIITLLILLYRFTNNSKGFWPALGACSYGIYIFHEPCVLYTQYFLTESLMSNTIKMIIAFTVGISVAWAITYALKRAPVTKRII